jgi:chitodextrinase/lysophospholipase L1-like esterase
VRAGHRALLLAVLTLLAAAVAFAVAAVPSASAATPVRIMPLGDSITGSPGCWRALLWNRLQNAGFTDIDMVGTLGPQGCGVPYDGDNEGHGGFLVTNVADQNQLVPWLAATLPDIVIMHFGTNDVWSSRPTATILAAYTKLVGQMRASNPNMKILVAKIIPMAASACGTGCPERAVDLNNAIPGWAASLTTTQSPITVVDQWTGFSTTTDTYDGIHPNAAGDQKISDKWFPALTAALGSTPPVDTTPPTTPGLPSVTPGCTSVTISWAPASDNIGVTGYDVYRAVGTGQFVLRATVTGTSYTDTGLTPATNYRYQIRARDAAGNLSPFTAAISATTTTCDMVAPTTPGTPTVINVGASSITISWTASTDNVGVTGYEIHRAPGTSGGTFTPVGTSGTTSFSDVGLPSSTTFRYQVRARDVAGNLSTFSAPVTATTSATTCTTPPTAPGAPTAPNITTNSVTLTWAPSTASCGLAAYEILRAPGTTGGTFVVVGTVPAPPFTNTGLSPATTYRYQIRARDGAGNVSAVSPTTTVTTQTGGTPGGCTATYRLTNQWTGGFQGEVTVTNTGTTPTSSWSVTLTFANGQRITQLWGARTTQTASPYTIGNESWNALLSPSQSTAFGFLGSWSGTNSAPTVTCSRTP